MSRRPQETPVNPMAALDFITSLPLLSENMVILMIVDGFSNMAHFVSMSKLLLAAETEELLLQHVLRLHGILRDIISDQGQWCQ